MNITLSAVAWEMHPLMSQDRGGSYEKKLAKFADHETRAQLVGLIRKSQRNELKAQEIIEQIVYTLGGTR